MINKFKGECGCRTWVNSNAMAIKVFCPKCKTCHEFPKENNALKEDSVPEKVVQNDSRQLKDRKILQGETNLEQCSSHIPADTFKDKTEVNNG